MSYYLARFTHYDNDGNMKKAISVYCETQEQAKRYAQSKENDYDFVKANVLDYPQNKASVNEWANIGLAFNVIQGSVYKVDDDGNEKLTCKCFSQSLSIYHNLFRHEHYITA